MAKIEKTAPQTQKVWTAQDFRERNKRVDLEKRAKAKSMLENELMPDFIKVLNQYYKSDWAQIKEIQLIERRTVSMDDYVIDAIKEWAEPFGYEVNPTPTKILLIIPDKPKAEKYEDS